MLLRSRGNRLEGYVHREAAKGLEPAPHERDEPAVSEASIVQSDLHAWVSNSGTWNFAVSLPWTTDRSGVTTMEIATRSNMRRMEIKL